MSERFLVIVEVKVDDCFEQRLDDVVQVISPIKHIEGIEGSLKLVRGQKVTKILDIFWAPEYE